MRLFGKPVGYCLGDIVSCYLHLRDLDVLCHLLVTALNLIRPESDLSHDGAKL